MQAGASYSVGDLKEKIEVAMKAAQAHDQQASEQSETAPPCRDAGLEAIDTSTRHVVFR
jgi:hypothetical protein